jgi:hypothetical protein
MVKLQKSIKRLPMLRNDEVTSAELDTLFQANQRTEAAIRVRLEQQDTISSLLSTVEYRVSTASTNPARTRQVLAVEERLLCDCSTLLRNLCSRSGIARRAALRMGAPGILSAALKYPVAQEPFQFEIAGLVTALCREGCGARALSTSGAIVTALAELACHPKSSERLRRASAEALDRVCGAPSGAAAALPALPALVGALDQGNAGGAAALVGDDCVPPVGQETRILLP